MPRRVSPGRRLSSPGTGKLALSGVYVCTHMLILVWCSKRFILAFTIMLCQQFSGTNSIGYCKPSPYSPRQTRMIH